jgi:hypothetical protein
MECGEKERREDAATPKPASAGPKPETYRDLLKEGRVRDVEEKSCCNYQKWCGFR